ncbi:MAG: hypothetical protein LUQ25_08820 [Methanoregulaceae archaeon]|nr:hypothetical protein [Methanoregulaceae archaeon]
MKEETRWTLFVASGLLALSFILFVAHYLLFQDAHHLWIFFFGDLAFIPIEVLVVTLIIERLLESREKEQRKEKMNMVIGTFFSRLGTPLLATLSRADPGIESIGGVLHSFHHADAESFGGLRACLDTHECSVRIGRLDLGNLRRFLISHEDFLLRLLENPMVFEHESFTSLLFAIEHLTEELKARTNIGGLPDSDLNHLETDIGRAYRILVPEWAGYMNYLRTHYPYLYSLAVRTNPFAESPDPVVRDQGPTGTPS